MMGSSNGRPAAESGSRDSASRESSRRNEFVQNDVFDSGRGVEFVHKDDLYCVYPKQGFDQAQSAAMLNIIVAYGSTLHNVSVSSDSTFGDLKRTFAEEILIKPQMQKIFFRGKEKDDCEQLQMAGVKDRSKVVLAENAINKELCTEHTNQTSELSRGVAAVAGIRAEVDQLSEKVSTLQSALHSGTKVDEKEIIYLTEMFMRQLLKLDGIEAEGDGKIQRKMEVRRVQNFVDSMDDLKTRNSNPFNDYTSSVSVTTEWEQFDSSAGNTAAPTATPTVMPSTKVTQEWEKFD